MLMMTDNAAAAIRTLTAQQEVPQGAGLRIATDPDAGSLTLSLAAAPEDGDQVLDASDGALLFVDSQAAPMLDDKALDASDDPQSGGIQFTLAEQPG